MSEFLNFLLNNPLLSASLLGVLAAWIFWEIQQLRRGFVVLSPAQTVEWINRKQARVIDLAENNDFLKAHIDGASNIPSSDFSPTHKNLKCAPDRPLVIYDRNGVGAERVAATLVRAGFSQVAVLGGGIEAWQRDSLPTAKGR